ncbi:MAG: ATP-binding protein, partial [Dehalococcoidia bacterium]
HELASPLQAIINFAQGLLMDDRAEEDREVLEIIEREAHRMASIVADLKNVARSAQEEETEKLAVDLNEVVRHILKVQDYRLKMSNVEVREDLPDDLPKVLADRAKLEQVVLNLVVNAEQAMSSSAGEGRLILRTRASAKGVALHVVDNGPGISANQLENIFDPFFTTKEPGEGTGLGLSLVKDLVNDHDGEIRVDSEVGSGSAFCVDWPRASALPLNAESTAAHEISVQPLRILVVDDEPAIRHVTGRYLRRRGHTVEEAGDGVAALELVESGSYDVILTDLRMPGLSGDSMAERLKEKGLADKVVFMTGALSGGTESLARMGVPVLLKPVNSQEIARAVEMVGRRFAN